MTVLADDSLGVVHIVNDHVESLPARARNGSSSRRRAVLLHYALPAAVGVAALILGLLTHGRTRAVGEMLTGVSIITGLLFALLIYVLQTGLNVSADPRWTASSPLTTTVRDLRANVSYACAVGMVAVGALILAAAFEAAKGSAKGTSSVWWLPVLVFLIGHLALTLLLILKRVRTAYLEMAAR